MLETERLASRQFEGDAVHCLDRADLALDERPARERKMHLQASDAQDRIRQLQSKP
jgi:hypothetical protein